MSERADPVVVLSQSVLKRFGIDCGKRLHDVVREVGLEVVYRDADSYEGALLRIKGFPRGYVVINSRIREESRRRFTVAHEWGHFILPDQQDLSAPCQKERIENWDDDLYHPELEANRFAIEILIPREFVLDYLRTEPSFDSARSIAGICQTSLTASIMRLVTLTSFRAAVVWSQENHVRWYKSSPEFSRWIRRGELNDATFAADCFKNRSVPGQLESVPGSAWLFEKGLRDGARIWEHSIPLPSYDAVLSLLVMREPVEAWDDSLPADRDLDPNEFTVNRRRWPSKR